MTSSCFTAWLPRSGVPVLLSVRVAGAMPPKTKRRLQLEKSLEKAREKKRRQDSGEGSSCSVTETQTEVVSEAISLTTLITMDKDALDTDDEAVDPSFDLDSSVRSDVDHLVDSFCEDWVCHLDRGDRDSLGLFLCFQLTKRFELGETKAAELAGIMTGKSDKSIQEWRVHFTQNGEIPESKQGKY